MYIVGYFAMHSIGMISYGLNYNLEPLNLNEGKDLEHSVVLQDTVVYESNGGTMKVNSQKHVAMYVTSMYSHMHAHTHACTHAHTHTNNTHI